MSRWARWQGALDPWLFRGPFRSAVAARYATRQRQAFGDLDARVIARLGEALDRPGARLLDLGAGGGAFAAAVAARHPRCLVIGVEPSRAAAWPGVVRARAEALPLADRAVDVAVAISVIRHVVDRAAALRELRRVVRARVLIVELDPEAPAARVAAHARRLPRWQRRAFGPLIVRTAPRAAHIAQLAEAAGFRVVAREPDPHQPVYWLDLT